MTIQLDPTENEFQALDNMAGSFAGKPALEVGCGDGRLTWHYANQTRQVIGIDPKEERIREAQDRIPSELKDKVIFLAQSLEEYYTGRRQSDTFDRVLLSWSL